MLSRIPPITQAALAIHAIRWKLADMLSASGNYRATEFTNEHPWLSALKREGYYVIPGFFSPDECAELRDTIDSYIDQLGEQVWRDDMRSDERLYGAEQIPSPLLERFANHSGFFHMSDVIHRSKSALEFLLAARLTFKPGNLGSGGGWHRDSIRPQFKSILYLSDVTEENGPFQYIEGSQALGQMMRDTLIARAAPAQIRFSDDEIDHILQRTSPDRLKSFCAEAGTLILTSTTGIHRGKPIEKGARYALTNYFMRERHCDAVRAGHAHMMINLPDNQRAAA